MGHETVVAKPRRRRLWPCCLVGILAVGCGGAGGRGASSASCAAAVGWHRHLYVDVGPRRAPLRRGRLLGRATVPPCQDSNVGPPEHATPDGLVYRVRGAPSRLLITRHAVYVAPGFVVTLRSFPFHGYFARVLAPALPRGQCRRPVRLRGRLLESPIPGQFLGLRTTTGRDVELAFDASSDVHTGRMLDGQPLLRRGDRLRVRGLACAGRGSIVLVRRAEA